MIGKNSVRVQKRFSSPRLAQKLDDRRIKTSPNLTKIRRHDHKGLVNMTTKGIDELLHGWRGIEEISSKIGVFSRTQQLRFGGTRDSGGYSTRLEDFESLQRVTKSSRIKSLTCTHESTKENRNSIKRGTRWTRTRWIQNPGGHKEGWASFPEQSQYKILKNPWLKTLVLERRGREPREREGDGRRAAALFLR